MKAKKIIAGILAASGLLTATFAVSAQTITRDMGKSYSAMTNNGVGYMYYYVGSTRPYDDVFAYAETQITSGMEGFASVSLTALNNQVVTEYSNKVINNSYIRTANAGVSGQDVAKNVRFMGSRNEKGSETYKTYNYTIK